MVDFHRPGHVFPAYIVNFDTQIVCNKYIITIYLYVLFEDMGTWVHGLSNCLQLCNKILYNHLVTFNAKASTTKYIYNQLTSIIMEVNV